MQVAPHLHTCVCGGDQYVKRPIKAPGPFIGNRVTPFVRVDQRIQSPSEEIVCPRLAAQLMMLKNSRFESHLLPREGKKKNLSELMKSRESQIRRKKKRSLSLSSNRGTERSDGPTTLAAFLISPGGVHRVHAQAARVTGSLTGDELQTPSAIVESEVSAAYCDEPPSGEKLQFLQKRPPCWPAIKPLHGPSIQSFACWAAG